MSLGQEKPPRKTRKTVKKPTVTLDQLINVLREEAESPEEVVATAVHMVNSGAVLLAGHDNDRRLDLEQLTALDDYLLAA